LARVILTKEVGLVLCPDTAGLDMGGVTWAISINNACSDSCPAREGKPDPASQSQRVGASRGDRGCDLSIAQEKGATILSLAKVIMDVMACDSMERVGRMEPFIQTSSWWHFLVEVALVYSKDINLELGLESPKVLYL